MTAIDLPTALHGARSNENFWLVGSSAALRGLDGREQVTFVENRYWVGQIDLGYVFGADKLAARSVGTRLRGRANALRVRFDNRGGLRFNGDLAQFYIEVGVPEEIVSRGQINFGEGAGFSDGSGFALPDPAEPTVVYDAPAGTSALQLDGYIGRHMGVGERFSINDFMYEVEENDDGAVVFSPPLRRAVSAGGTVYVNEPSILVRLADDRGWEPFTQYGHHNRPMTVNVVEAFDRD